MELLPPELIAMNLKPVGRLDKATEGLLLFTNDGDLLHRLISPKKEVPKVYYARHEGTAADADVAAFATGGLGTPPKPDVLAQPPVTDVPKVKEEAIHVYSTECSNFYHLEPNCSGMENAIETFVQLVLG